MKIVLSDLLEMSQKGFGPKCTPNVLQLFGAKKCLRRDVINVIRRFVSPFYRQYFQLKI
jgi:hypothetical protein